MNFDEPGFRKCLATGERIEQIYFRDQDNPASPYHNEKTLDILNPTTLERKNRRRGQRRDFDDDYRKSTQKLHYSINNRNINLAPFHLRLCNNTRAHNGNERRAEQASLKARRSTGSLWRTPTNSLHHRYRWSHYIHRNTVKKIWNKP
jgi:hypothetical protein